MAHSGISRSLLRPLPVFHISPSPACRRQAPQPQAAQLRLPGQQVRHESTRRRLIKKLRLPPSPSFASPSSTSKEHIIFNPPSSAPNVYHTPPKFLPVSDPRRQLYTQLRQTPSNTERPSGRSVSSTPPAADADGAPATNLPTALRPYQPKKYHLTADDVAEMQRLRAEDPAKWTRSALAKKFACSNTFVGIACKSLEAGKAHVDQLEEIKAKWGPRKRRAREHRAKRKEAWGTDI